MFDLDMLVVEKPSEPEILGGMFGEYNTAGKCRAIVEAKHINAGSIDLSGFQFRCLTDLADRANLTLWCVCYCPLDSNGIPVNNDTRDPHQSDLIKHWQFIVYPVNQLARIESKQERIKMTARHYVRFQYWLRREVASPEFLAGFDNTWIEVAEPRIHGTPAHVGENGISAISSDQKDPAPTV